MKIKGNNEIHLCEAAMMQIVQEWLDANTEFNARVTSIKASNVGYEVNLFQIKLTDEEK